MVGSLNSDTSSHRRPNPRDLLLPYDEWRPSQWDSIERIANSNKRYHLVQASTGFGKSGLALGTMRYPNQKGIIVVKTKQLQEQYEEKLGLPPLMGTNNYKCNHSPTDDNEDLRYLSCDRGFYCSTISREDNEAKIEISDRERERCLVCEYKLCRNTALKSNEFVTNYDFFLVQNFLPKRDILVLDEAHFADKELAEAISFTIHDKLLKKNNVSIPEPIFSYNEWRKIFEKITINLKIDENELKEHIDWLRNEIQLFKKRNITPPKKLEQDFSENISELKKIEKQIKKIDFLHRNLDSNWIINYQKKSVEFKPIWSNTFTSEYYFSYADKIILMSATILDKDLFCKIMGIEPSECEFYDIPMRWNKYNRPIFYKPICDCSSKHIEANKPSLLKAIDEEISKRPNQKGVIHTTTGIEKKEGFSLSRYIYENSAHKKILLTHTTKNRAEILEIFKQSPPPRVLISPSMRTGVDLPYDLCRYQILAKVPFPDLGDELIKRRVKSNPLWYPWATACEIIQAYGRGVRAEDDYCDFLIFDSSFEGFYLRNKNLFPTWFTEAIIWD